MKLKLGPEDKIAAGFSIIIIALQLYFYPFITSLTVILGFAALFLFISLQQRFKNRFFRFLRSYYHILYYGLIFTSFQSFIHMLNPNDYDWLLLKWDYAVFGFDITVWLEQFVSKGLTELLTLSYFSYYILPSLTFIILFFSAGNSIYRKYILAVVFGWYTAFIFYVILPAAGPDIAYPEHYNIPLSGLSAITVTYLQNLGQYLRESSVRNTFPSMHFAIILISNYFAFIYKRKYFWFCTMPLGTLLAVATVYLRQHYLIDLIGSILVAAGSIYFSYWAVKKQIT